MIFEKGKIKVTNSKGTWTKKENWSTEDEIYEFIYGMVRALKPQVCVDSGTFEGDGTVAIAEALKENRNGGKVYTIDHKNFGTTEKLGKYDNVVIVRGSAPNIIGTLDITKIDFAFLDSGHDFGQVTKELKFIDRYMTKTGYILIHDVLHGNWGEGAMKAMETFVAETKDRYHYIFLTNYNGLGILQRI